LREVKTMPEFDFGKYKKPDPETGLIDIPILEEKRKVIHISPPKKRTPKAPKLTVEETEFMFEYFDKIGRKRWGLKEDQKKAREIFLKLAK
jgi:hypothetical protein